jgi:ubiquinone biosynthesis protein
MPDIRVPRVYPTLSTARVLDMEWLDGVSARQRGRIEELRLKCEELADRLLRCSLHQMLVDGHFHADPHPGNVLVLRDGQIALIDFGPAGRIDPIQQSALRQMMIAISQKDPNLLRQGILEVATVHRDADDTYSRSVGRTLGRPLGALGRYRLPLPTDTLTGIR